MNNGMKIFENKEFGKVRMFKENDKILFAGSDVAKALGYNNPPDALRRHCKGIVKRDTLTSGGQQTILYIPEGDVYRLIIASKLPAADRFEQWVFEEVLPSIRKHGAYVTDELLANGDKLNQTIEELKAEHTLRIKAERENDELRLRCDTAENKLAVIDEKNKAKVEKLLATNKAKREAESLSSAQVLVAMARRIAIKHCRGDFRHGTNSLYKTIECSGIDLRARRDEWLSTHAANKSSNAPKLYEFIRADEMDGCILAVTNYFSRIDFSDIVSRHNKAA